MQIIMWLTLHVIIDVYLYLLFFFLLFVVIVVFVAIISNLLGLVPIDAANIVANLRMFWCSCGVLQLPLMSCHFIHNATADIPFIVAIVFVRPNAVISIKDANQCMKWNCGVFIYLLTNSFVVGVVVIGGVILLQIANCFQLSFLRNNNYLCM